MNIFIPFCFFILSALQFDQFHITAGQLKSWIPDLAPSSVGLVPFLNYWIA